MTLCSQPDHSSSEFPRREAGDEVSRSVERAALEAGELVRMQRRLDELERRIEGRRAL